MNESEHLAIGDTVVVEWKPGEPMVAKVVNIDHATGSCEVSFSRMEMVTRQSWCTARDVKRVAT